MELLRVDCGTCVMRGVSCDGCMMSVLLAPVEESAFDQGEVVALAALVGEGLLPPLRLVAGEARRDEVGGADLRSRPDTMFADTERVV